MVRSMFDKGFTSLLSFASGTRLKPVLSMLTLSVHFLYEIFYAGWSSPAGMVVSMFDKGFTYLSPYFSSGKRLKSILNTLTLSVHFLSEIFYAGWSSPAGMVVSMFNKGFMYLSPIASWIRLKSILNTLTLSVHFLSEIFYAGWSSPAGMVRSMFDKVVEYSSPYLAAGIPLNIVAVNVQFLYEIFCAGWSSPAGMIASVFDKGFMYLLLFFTTMKKIVPQFNSSGGRGQGPPSGPRPPGSKKISKTQIVSLKRNIPATPPPPKPPVVKAPVVKAPVVKAPVVKAPVVKAPVAKAPVVKVPVVKAPVVSARPPPMQQSSSESSSRQDTSPVMLLTMPNYGASSGSTGSLPLSRRILRNMWRTACLCLAALILAPRNDFNFQSIGNIRVMIQESNTYRLLLSNARSAQAALLRFYHSIQGPARPDVVIPASKEPSLPVFVRRHIAELSNGCPFLKKL
jgi:hypothetical protein